MEITLILLVKVVVVISLLGYVVYRALPESGSTPGKPVTVKGSDVELWKAANASINSFGTLTPQERQALESWRSKIAAQQMPLAERTAADETKTA